MRAVWFRVNTSIYNTNARNVKVRCESEFSVRFNVSVQSAGNRCFQHVVDRPVQRKNFLQLQAVRKALLAIFACTFTTISSSYARLCVCVYDPLNRRPLTSSWHTRCAPVPVRNPLLVTPCPIRLRYWIPILWCFCRCTLAMPLAV